MIGHFDIEPINPGDLCIYDWYHKVVQIWEAVEGTDATDARGNFKVRILFEFGGRGEIGKVVARLAIGDFRKYSAHVRKMPHQSILLLFEGRAS